MQTFYFSHTADAVVSAELWDIATDTLVEDVGSVARTKNPYAAGTLPNDAATWYVGTASDNLFGNYELVLRNVANNVLAVKVVALTGPMVDASTSPTPLEPFQNLAVYHKFYGQSVATWQLNAAFSIAAPHVYQLEASLGGHANAGDWVPITPTVSNVQELPFYQVREQQGKLLTTYVRLVLWAGGRKFVSAPTPIGYALDARQQKQADEIVRKEHLRMQLAGSQAGYLLKAYRYGEPAKQSRDPGTQEVISENSTTSYARPFVNGYYPPIPLVLDTVLLAGTETVGDGNPPTNNSATPGLVARAVAHPPVQTEDIWVDAVSDKRYVIREIKPAASIGGQVLIVQLAMQLLPFSHVVYKIPVDRLSFRRHVSQTPAIGLGCAEVNHDFPIPDAMSYMLSDCCGVQGATVRIYPAASTATGDYSNAELIAETITTVGGHWQHTIRLRPGNYVVVFEKPGVAGPDSYAFSVPEPVEPPEIAPIPSTNFSSVVDL